MAGSPRWPRSAASSRRPPWLMAAISNWAARSPRPKPSVQPKAIRRCDLYAEAELEVLRQRHATEGEALRDLIYDREAGADHVA